MRRASTTIRRRRSDAPRWFNVDVKLVEKTRLVSIAEMRAEPALADMITLRKGNRLSITPVTPKEWAAIVKLAARKAPAA